jgi:hypothetical protein
MAYSLVLCQSGAWGVAEGTLCVVSGTDVPTLVSSLGRHLRLVILQLEYYDADFKEWCRLEGLPSAEEPIKVRLVAVQHAEPEPELELEPEPEPEPEHEMIKEAALIEAEDAAKMVSFALAHAVSSRRGGVSSLRQTADVVAEASTSARAVVAAEGGSHRVGPNCATWPSVLAANP